MKELNLKFEITQIHKEENQSKETNKILNKLIKVFLAS